MIINKKGNLLKSEDCTAIIHQTNCLGVMGAGIAKQIKTYWLREVYEPYRRLCLDNINTKNLLGKIQVLTTNEKPIEYVINAFGEYAYRREVKFVSDSQKLSQIVDVPFPNNRHTDYDALRECFEKIKAWCKEKKVFNIGMPKNLGCGIAGGDWKGVVYPMIQEIFEDDKEITLNIYEFYVNPFAEVEKRN